MSDNVKENVIVLPGSVSVRDLAQALGASPIDVIKTLMTNGVMANINQQVDFDTASIVASELGYEVELETIDLQESAAEGVVPLWKRLIQDQAPEDLLARPPVVTILGHVDHGKTTLLDAIRDTSVAAGEAGGITQHIGAYQVRHNDQLITFLDTPGHAAFTAMRARGAQGADIVVLVVAADDGVMPQTREALAHAKAAQVPLIVALNKVDRPNANMERVKRQLADAGLIPDDWEGDTIVVPVSAKEQTGIEDLLEAILLVANDTQIHANPNGRVIGSVIEAEVDRYRGVMTTLLIQNGTVSVGDVVLAGIAHGRIKAMFDYNGKDVTSAGPSTPVSVMGLNEVPLAGELFVTVDSERDARAISAERQQKARQAQATVKSTVTLEKLFEQVRAGEVPELRLVVKADVQGSLEPIMDSLKNLSVGDIRVQILHSGTGNIGENDVMLAAASRAIVIGFNVDAEAAVPRLAEKEHISIRRYSIIYRLLEDVEKALKGMLEPEERLTTIGKAEVRAVFKVPRAGMIAGCYVLEGEIRRNAEARVIRKGEAIHDGPIGSLRHHEEDVREMRQGFECGIGLKDFDRFLVGDVIECFVREMVAAV
ncbi:MAG TPA: translation initiation factor IF-2 [Anaerolineales bacterium]|nr:translation initiation factor IF-2 [Anaerolineales bacterium]